MGGETGCWALITGSSEGIGYYAAEGLAREGCNVILYARRLERLQSAAEEIRRVYGVEAVPVRGDLRVREDIDRLMREAYTLTGGTLRVAALSYGNPECEPCTLTEAPWESWVEAAILYTASTAWILRWLIRAFRGRTVVAAFNSFTIYNPHPPLVVADTARRGLPVLLSTAARSWPGKIQAVHVVLGSFRTPGAERTVSRIAEREGIPFEEYWKSRVEALSPLGRTGVREDIWALARLLLGLPEYVVYTEFRLEGGVLPG